MPKNAEFDPISAGKSLREVDPRLLARKTQDASFRWFQGRGCDLFVWQDGAGQTMRAQFFLQKKLAEWSRGSGLRTGFIETPEARVLERSYPMSPVYKWHGAPDAALIESTRDVMSHAVLLPKALKEIF